MSKQQPEALRLAEMLTADEWPGSVTLVSYARECVAELLRQHAENETVRAGYAAARLEIESLKAQLHAAKQINAAQFGLLAASIPGGALVAEKAAAKEREACAQVCDEICAVRGVPFYGLPGMKGSAQECAAAIRARLEGNA